MTLRGFRKTPKRSGEPKWLSPAIVRIPSPITQTSTSGDIEFSPTGCALFANGTTPVRLLVEIAGFANQTCSDCATVFDREFIVTQDSVYPCLWRNIAGASGVCASWDEITINAYKPATNFPVFLQGNITSGGTLAYSFSVDTGDTLLDGNTLDETLAFASDDSSDCDSSSAILRVRAAP